MSNKRDLEKRKKIFNRLGAILGISGLVLIVCIGITSYNRGIYADEHGTSGYPTGIEVVIMVLVPVLLVTSVICFKIAQSNKQ